MEPLAAAISDLESRSQSLDVFHDSSIQIGNPNLEAVSHRELVGVHEQLIRKRRADLEELQAPELVRLLHLRKQLGPMREHPVAGVLRKQSFVEQPVDCLAW